MKTLIAGATVVNEGSSEQADVVVDGETIADVVIGGGVAHDCFDTVIDASGCIAMPGVIDEHVHFREPGLTAKADIASESRAAAAGGVTTYFDMPNTVPQTTTPDALSDKFARAEASSVVNYSFFFGATNDNADMLASLDRHSVPGVKLFMGSSTGNMLVDSPESLDMIFKSSPLPIMAHCEDTSIISANMQRIRDKHGADPDVAFHPAIRSEEACFVSTALAVSLARKHGARLHVAHVSTARELELIAPQEGITAEASVGHLLFTDADYATLGTRIKVNPAIKNEADRRALRFAAADGDICTVGSDHAPHLLSDKQGGCVKAASGMPLVQFSLVAMLTLASEGIFSVERVVELMCHNPAKIFGVRSRGYLRRGYKADIAIVRQAEPQAVEAQSVLSKCGWSPLEGRKMSWRVERTLCNGRLVYDGQCVCGGLAGQAVEFG